MSQEGQPAAEVREPRFCPYCGRIMSYREAAEQGACNECNGGAYDPRDGER
jgi:NADH pyrophosphatase NudC (nudix superfamily)